LFIQKIERIHAVHRSRLLPGARGRHPQGLTERRGRGQGAGPTAARASPTPASSQGPQEPGARDDARLLRDGRLHANGPAAGRPRHRGGDNLGQARGRALKERLYQGLHKHREDSQPYGGKLQQHQKRDALDADDSATSGRCPAEGREGAASHGCRFVPTQ
jgi:hypothetical protein